MDDLGNLKVGGVVVAVAVRMALEAELHLCLGAGLGHQHGRAEALVPRAGVGGAAPGLPALHGERREAIGIEDTSALADGERCWSASLALAVAVAVAAVSMCAEAGGQRSKGLGDVTIAGA